ncbi:MAG: penicillin acylase family protein [Litorimonas sp.]
MKKWLLGAAALVSIGLVGAAVYLRTPSAPPYSADTARQAAQGYDARIIRDGYGVPHVFGTRDADTAFGFGYAHAEDDWATIQDTLIAARGKSAEYKGKEAAPPDYLYDLFKVRESVEQNYQRDVSTEAKAIAKAYAAAMNLYAVNNPDQVLPNILPITEQDVLAGFAWATPFFYRLDGYLEELFTAEDRPNVSPWGQTSSLGHKSSQEVAYSVRGSNAFAVAPSRSEDGHTRLIANSHQPMTGPYAWYEAHLVSEEGMNTLGGTFPGVPIMAQGATPNLAWTHTVNRPDLIDIYALEVDDVDKPTRYRLDGEWIDFERTKSEFRVKLSGPFSLPIKRDVLWSKHGPVLSTPTGHYAIRFAGLGALEPGGLGALDQWLAMNKATNMAEWRASLESQGVLSFNIVYGDKDGNIGAVYNARMPRRIEGPEWEEVLPGDRSDLIWDEFRPVSDMPQIWNPPCGWVFSANATPFNITDDACNLDKADFSETFGIEDRITNRSLRALALLENDDAISREELLRYRADTKYAPESSLMRLVVEIVTTPTEDETLKQAQDILRNWDGDTTKNNRGAALAIITGTRALGYEYTEQERDPMDALSETASDLMTKFGRLDPEWGEVSRIIRGDVSVPLDGAPDVLRAIYADRDGVAKEGVMNAFAGDTHIVVADWAADGSYTVDSIHNYGSATLDETSPHYADQVELFANGGYKRDAMTLEDVLAGEVTADYTPGER